MTDENKREKIERAISKKLLTVVERNKEELFKATNQNVFRKNLLDFDVSVERVANNKLKVNIGEFTRVYYSVIIKR